MQDKPKNDQPTSTKIRAFDESFVGPRLWHIRFVRDLFVILTIIMTVVISFQIIQILLPIILALALAYICNPIAEYTQQRWQWSRLTSTVMIMLLGFSMIVLFFVALLPIIAEQAENMREQLPQYLERLTATLTERFDVGIDDLKGFLQQATQRIGQAYEIAARVFEATTFILLAIILTPIFFYFFLTRFDALIKNLDEYIPERNRARVHHILKRMDNATAGFFRGRILISLIVGILLSFGWLLAGVPYWFFLGVIAGILNVAPYASVLILPVAILAKYAESASGGDAGWMTTILWPSIVYFGVQLFENWVLNPWIESDRTQLSVPAVLFAVLVGGALGGFFGLLIGIPLLACIKIFLEEIVLPRIRTWAKL